MTKIRELKQIYAGVKDKGPGPHVLTGPVAIAGAMPGDVLEVETLDIRLGSSYGWMMIEPGAGSLQDEFPYLREKLIPLDGTRWLNSQRAFVSQFVRFSGTWAWRLLRAA
jgi:acetamidase/formamidase